MGDCVWSSQESDLEKVYNTCTHISITLSNRAQKVAKPMEELNF